MYGAGQIGGCSFRGRRSGWMPSRDDRSPRVQQCTGIYYATLFGLRGVVENLLKGDAAVIKTMIMHGNAVVACAYNGQPQLMKTLLMAGGEIDGQDQNGLTA